MGWAGFIGGALSSAGKSGLDFFDKRLAEEHDMAKMDKMKELQKQMEVDRENRIAERAKTPGTKENLELEAAKSNNELNTIKLGAAKDALAKEQVMNGQDAQFSDGSFRVTGGDGIIRRVMKDGTPIGDLDANGTLKGQTKKDYEESGLSLKEKAALRSVEASSKMHESAARRYDAMAENGGGAGGSRYNAEDRMRVEVLKSQLSSNKQRIHDLQSAIDKKVGLDPNEVSSKKAEISKIQDENTKIIYFANRGGDTSFTGEDRDMLADAFKSGDQRAISNAKVLFGDGKINSELEKLKGSGSQVKAHDDLDSHRAQVSSDRSAAIENRNKNTPTMPPAVDPDLSLRGGSLRSELMSAKAKVWSLEKQAQQNVPNAKALYDQAVARRDKLLRQLEAED